MGVTREVGWAQALLHDDRLPPLHNSVEFAFTWRTRDGAGGLISFH